MLQSKGISMNMNQQSNNGPTAQEMDLYSGKLKKIQATTLLKWRARKRHKDTDNFL
jgi:hypothetical protein